MDIKILEGIIGELNQESVSDVTLPPLNKEMLDRTDELIPAMDKSAAFKRLVDASLISYTLAQVDGRRGITISLAVGILIGEEAERRAHAARQRKAN